MPGNLSRGRRRILLEVCVESVDDAVAAAAGGADRIELNTALSLDGLTPTPGLLVETRKSVRLPLIVMARPRAGDFCYSDSEFCVLRHDVEYALEHGADGVAFGILTADRRIDVRRCRTVARAIRDGRDLVFHRAFDVTRTPLDALEQLIDMGVRRVMTSGGRPTAADGSPLVRRLIERAAGRIEILPAGGVRPGNAFAIVNQTGCDQLHTSLRDKTGRINVRWLRSMALRLRP